MPLNPMQQKFVKEYLLEQNATKAALKAGYSKKSAGQQAHELLKNPEIKAQIENGLKTQIQKLEKRAANRGVTKERWLKELEAIAFANMDDYAQIASIEIENGSLGKESTYTGVFARLTKDRPRRLGRAIKKLSETKNGIGIELHSKQAALDTIGKHFGWLKEQLDVRTPDGVQVIVTMPSNGREAPKEDQDPKDPESNGSS